jgi:hypothetical protein
LKKKIGKYFFPCFHEGGPIVKRGQLSGKFGYLEIIFKTV